MPGNDGNGNGRIFSKARGGRARALARVLCVLCLPAVLALAAGLLHTASAEDRVQGVLTYTLDGDNATITKCAATATDGQVAAAFEEIRSPGGIRTTTVAAIGSKAFQGCIDINPGRRDEHREFGV
jgi:hypothetical protein